MYSLPVFKSGEPIYEGDTMSVILIETHLSEVKRVRRKYCFVVFVLCLTLCLSFLWNVVAGIHQRLVAETYLMAKGEFDIILAKQRILSLLRTKPLTTGQALDMAEVILGQKTVPLPIVLAILEQESEFNTNAVSHKGARGVMQVMPATWKTYANHPLLKGEAQMHNPVMNVQVGLLYLGDLFRKYNDWTKALRAYQAGESNADSKQFDWYVNQVFAKAAAYSTD